MSIAQNQNFKNFKLLKYKKKNMINIWLFLVKIPTHIGQEMFTFLQSRDSEE